MHSKIDTAMPYNTEAPSERVSRGDAECADGQRIAWSEPALIRNTNDELRVTSWLPDRPIQTGNQCHADASEYGMVGTEDVVGPASRTSAPAFVEPIRTWAPAQLLDDTLAAPLSIPSIGSASHLSGNCKPCAFFHTKGCESGVTCKFCHMCEAGEKKRREKAKQNFFKEMRRVRRVHTHVQNFVCELQSLGAWDNAIDGAALA